MKCVKTGADVHYGGGHVYSGDAFECPGCGQQIVHTNAAPRHDNDWWTIEYYVEMPREE